MARARRESWRLVPVEIRMVHDNCIIRTQLKADSEQVCVVSVLSSFPDRRTLLNTGIDSCWFFFCIFFLVHAHSLARTFIHSSSIV